MTIETLEVGFTCTQPVASGAVSGAVQRLMRTGKSARRDLSCCRANEKKCTRNDLEDQATFTWFCHLRSAAIPAGTAIVTSFFECAQGARSLKSHVSHLSAPRRLSPGWVNLLRCPDVSAGAKSGPARFPYKILNLAARILDSCDPHHTTLCAGSPKTKPELGTL